MTRDDEPRPDAPGATASSPRTIRFDDLAGDDDAGLAPRAEPPPWRRSSAAAPPADPVQPRSLVDEPTVPLRIPPVPTTSAATTPSAPAPPAPASSAPASPPPASSAPAPPAPAPPAPASLPADPSRRTVVFDDLSSARAPEPAAPVAATASVRSAAPARSTARAADPSTPVPPLRARPRPGDARRTAVSAVAAPAADEAPTREPVPVGRALAGAALAVSGVALGIVVLLWITGDPDRDTVADGLGAEVSQSAVEPAAPVEPSPPAQAAPPAVPAPAAPPPPAPPTTAPATPVVPVTVLNNSRRSGLAARAAAVFEEGGWPVATTGNFRGRIPVTTVYYDPGLEASARALADSFDGIARVRPRFETLPARGVVVVVTREFAT